jgi:hypothetical protein
MLRKGLAWIVLTCALLLCVHVEGAEQSRELKLNAGRVVTLDEGRLRVRFVSVASDSRCPTDVDCVWAGNAEVVFEVSGSRRGSRTFRLNTSASPERPGEGRYGRYTLKLTALAPQPRSNRKIAPGQYTATLLVSKD